MINLTETAAILGTAAVGGAILEAGSLDRRSATSWIDYVVLGAVVISVIAVAACYFVNLPAAGACFALLGTIHALSYYRILRVGEDASLDQVRSTLEETKTALDEAHEHLSEAEENHQKQIEELQELHAPINQQLKEQLEINNSLSAKNNELEKNISLLTEKINTLQIALSKIKSEIQTFASQQDTLGKEIDNFDRNVLNFDEENREFSDQIEVLDKRIDEDVGQIGTTIAHLKDLKEKHQSDFDIQLQQIDAQQEIIKSTTLQLEKIKEELSERQQGLNELDNEMSIKLEQLQELEKNIEKAGANLHSENQALEKVSVSLIKKEQELDDLAKRYESIYVKFEEFNRLMQEKLSKAK